MYIKKRFEAKKAEAAGKIDAPVIVYIGESGDGKDRAITLEGATIFDKLLALADEGTYASIGPAQDSDLWKKLDADSQSYFKDVQAKAKRLKTYKAMGEFLSELCSNQESFLFAIRQGANALWVNPDLSDELANNPWNGDDDDADWLESL